MLKLRNWDGLTVLYCDSATDKSDMFQMAWMKSGWFWRTFVKVLQSEPIELIVDVGAHMGSFSLPAIVEARRHLLAARLVAPNRKRNLTTYLSRTCISTTSAAISKFSMSELGRLTVSQSCRSPAKGGAIPHTRINRQT